MQYGRAVKFPARSEGWIGKIVIGVAVMLVPILNWAVYGYGVEVTRRVMFGEREELPPWDKLGRYVARGFAMTVASFLYALPGILLFLLLIIGGQGEATLTVVGGLLYVLYGLIVAFIIPVAYVRYAMTDEWYTMFDFGWIFGVVGSNLGSLLALYLVWIVLAVALMTLGTIALIVGALFAAFWAMLILFHLLGQIGRRTVPAR